MVDADGTAQLIDFGLSVVLTVTGFTTTLLRNARYTAPELMPMTEAASIRPTFKSDIFSLAMCILEVGTLSAIFKTLPQFICVCRCSIRPLLFRTEPRCRTINTRHLLLWAIVGSYSMCMRGRDR
jgi:serine/threonine protein kinase